MSPETPKNSNEKPQESEIVAFENADEREECLLLYDFLKSKEVPVADTFEEDPVSTNAYMSPLAEKGQAALNGINVMGQEILMTRDIKEITNFEDLVTTMMDEAKKLNDLGIKIPAQAYYFILDTESEKEEGVKVDFVVGRYDQMYLYQPEEEEPEIGLVDVSQTIDHNHPLFTKRRFEESHTSNFSEVADALSYFMKAYVTPDQEEEYQHDIDSIMMNYV